MSAALGIIWVSGDLIRIEVWGNYPETYVQCLRNGLRIGNPYLEANGLSGQLAGVLSTSSGSKLGRLTAADFDGPVFGPIAGPGPCSRLLLGIVCH